MSVNQEYNKIFDNWSVVKLIGSGGYGKVYELQREEGNSVFKSAMKVVTIPQNDSEIAILRAEGQSQEDIKRYFKERLDTFLNENRIMADLKGNSYIVSYEDHRVIPHDDGIGYDIFIRMELLASFVDFLIEGTITEKTIILLGIDICQALEVCERKKIIHRDIKPSNIFLSSAGDFKIGDFGIARTLEMTSGEMSKKGTYKYMAPEIYKGESYGKTVDIYSLGLVMYHLANGKRAPFLPEKSEKITYEDEEKALLRRVRGEKLPPPCHASSALSAIILKACAYDASNRYSSAYQMRRDLENLLANEENNIAAVREREKPKETPKQPKLPAREKEVKQKPEQKKKPKPQKPKLQKPKSKHKTGKPIEKKKLIIAASWALIVVIGLIIGFNPNNMDSNSSGGLILGGSQQLMYDTGVKGTFGDSQGMSKEEKMFDCFDRDDIQSIVFLKSNKDASGQIKDVSEEQDGSVLAWMSSEEPDVLYIGAKGGVKANKNCNGLFAYCENLREIYFNNAFDTSEVTEMRYLFYNCDNLRSVDMGNINTSNVTMMDRMFAFCTYLERIDNMHFDTELVKDMTGMFKDCKNLKAVETSTWDTSNVETMYRMFENCHELVSVDTSGMNTENVRGFQYMFYNCYELIDLDVSNFDTSSATSMYAMFSHCESIKNLDVSNFDTKNVKSMKYMFVSCENVTELDVSGFDTSSLGGEDVYHIFYNCNSSAVSGYEGWDEYDDYDSNRMFDMGA